MFISLDGAGTNKQHVITKNTAKLDRETEELKHDKIPLEVGKLIQEGRKNKGLKQTDLAAVSCFSLFFPRHQSNHRWILFPFYRQKICEKPQIITEYEAGRGIPNNVILGKIERVIGVKLRGKDLGKPLLPPGPKKWAAGGQENNNFRKLMNQH